MITFDEFMSRLDGVRGQIGQACARAGRDPASVELMAVTKTHPVAAAEYAARAGLRAVGENRVQEGCEKRPLAPAGLSWELIGHLQTNKAKLAVQFFDRIQSVDSEKLVNHLDRAAGELGRRTGILLQINAGNDPAKFGVDPVAAARLLECVLGKHNLRVDGVMTIAPLSDDPAVAERTFVNLRTIRDELAVKFAVPLPVLSMGMSGDMGAAIAAGSTLVRVGTALFGTRG